MFSEGDTVGAYELIRRLGGGAFGEVWLVRHMDLGVERAMKIPTDPDYVRQLRQEGKIQFQLHHPNIVETAELNTRHDPPYFVMEYVEGQDLRKRLKAGGKLTVPEALEVVRQILEAMEHAHGQGVLHRDLKPENILMTPDGTVKITDFGLGKVQADLAQSLLLSGSMMSSQGISVSGTYDYMSPEQRSGGQADPRDDLYAVGIIGCELLTGRRPTGAGMARAMSRNDIERSIGDVFEKACDDVDYRYESAAEMLSAVTALLHGVPEERPPSRGEAVRPAPKLAETALQSIELDCGSGVEMKLVLIPAGEFMMGSPDSEKHRGQDEGPQRRVTISTPFHIGTTQVTQGQWRAVMDTEPWKGWLFTKAFARVGDDNAVSYISWHEAMAFCEALSKKTRKSVRLPTEAEWEYACRAGTTTRFSYGDDPDYGNLGDYAWYDGNARREKYAHPVGLKKPNAWGLHDMHGNVWEWCSDRYADSYAGEDTRDPKGPSSGSSRVSHGGSWYSSPWYCRTARRYGHLPSYRLNYIGFRVVVASGSSVD